MKFKLFCYYKNDNDEWILQIFEKKNEVKARFCAVEWAAGEKERYYSRRQMNRVWRETESIPWLLQVEVFL